MRASEPNPPRPRKITPSPEAIRPVYPARRVVSSEVFDARAEVDAAEREAAAIRAEAEDDARAERARARRRTAGG